MDRQTVQERYLTIGYKRRDAGEKTTESGRHVMGRKGIGKLSLFAIADTVDVITAPHGGLVTAFRLHAPLIRERALARQIYYPEEITVADPPDRGTRIELTNLRVSPGTLTTAALRKRLARRFAIIGGQFGFRVWVNNEEVTVEDRDDLPQLQYLWTVGHNNPDPVQAATRAAKHRELDIKVEVPSGVAVQEGPWSIHGWLGTFRDQRAVNPDEGDNQVPVLAWGKVVHEDLLSNVKASGYFARYLTGRLEANFLDFDLEPDIATSNRQSVKETDPRFGALIIWFQNVLREIANDWNTWREDTSLNDAMDEFPSIREWHANLTGDAKRFAKQLFGKIGRLNKADPGTKYELYRNAIIAFERLRLRDELAKINELSDEPDLTVLTTLFRGIDEIEEVEYHRIAEGRLAVVQKFQNLISDDAREKSLQEYLFNHLWLLDPSWERATATEYMEKTVLSAFQSVTENLTEEEKRARIDIGYRTHAGKHVIVELKRASVRPNITQLSGQLAKYREALQRVLSQVSTSGERLPEIEMIAVLGDDPAGPPSSREEQAGMLRPLNARWITYGSLFRNTAEVYKEYVQAHERASKLTDLIAQIGPVTSTE